MDGESGMLSMFHKGFTNPRVMASCPTRGTKIIPGPSQSWGNNRLHKGALLHPGSRQGMWRQLFWRKFEHQQPLWAHLGISATAMKSSVIRQQGYSCLEYSNPEDTLKDLCRSGQLDRAVDVLLRMDENEIVPSVVTYGSLLRACTRQKSLNQAKRVHAHMAKHGLDSSMFLGETVVSTLVTCGGLEYALQLFYKLSYRSVFSWTAIISGYAASGQGQEALRMYKCMQEEGVLPNAYTFVSLLKACGSIANLKEGKRIHTEAVKHQCESDLFVGNCLVNMYGKCGSIVDAHNVFDRLPQRDVVSWNAMLKAYCQQDQAEKAMQLYEQMMEGPTSPDVRTFVSAIQACGMLADKEAVAAHEQFIKDKSLRRGIAIHADARRKGFDTDVFVGNTLISMYGKCGSIIGAQNVFEGLRHRDVVSWNAMLAAFAHQGEVDKALKLYEQMQVEGVTPNNLTCSSLVSVYGQCGNIVGAQIMFDGLSQRDVVLWNAMLAAYADQSKAEKVLELYQQMQEDGVSPDTCTFVSVLQACCMLAENENDVSQNGRSTRMKYLELGKSIHADAHRKGYDADVFVGSSLVHMYGKCGSIAEAHNIFHRLPQRDVVAWSTMIVAYVEQGYAEKALQLYEEMQQEGVSPNDRTFVSTLQACGMLAEEEEHLVLDGKVIAVKLLQKVKAIHADVHRRAYDSDAVVGSTIVSMYGRCGSITDAEIVFYGLSYRDVVAWTAMLSAYVEQDQPDLAIQHFEEMQEEGVSPNERTLVSTLQACGMLAEKVVDVDVDVQSTKMKWLNQGKAFHADSRIRGYDSDVFVGNTLISMYGKCGCIVEAENVFSGLSQRNVVSWNAILAAYGQQGQPLKALEVYDEMRKEGVEPNDQTCNTLVGMFGKCGRSMVDAENVFDRLSHRDVVAWTAMLAAYVGQGQAEKALQLYERMLEEGVSPNSYTFVSTLQACAMLAEDEEGVEVDGLTKKLKSLERGVVVHSDLVKKGYSLDVFVTSALITMYGKCGSLEEAWHVFDGLSERDVVAWTAMLTAYVDQGQPENALALYDRMQEQGLSPNDRTCVCALQACSMEAEKEGVVDGNSTKGHFLGKGKAIHAHVCRHGYDSDIFVVSALITMYGKCGDIGLAQSVFNGLAVRDVVLWNAMLAAHVEQGCGEEGLQLYRQMQQERASPDGNTILWVFRACSSTGSLGMLREVHQTIMSAGSELSACLRSTLINAYGKCASMRDAETVFGALPVADVVSWNALIASYARQGDAAAGLNWYEKMQPLGVNPNGATFLSILSACSHAGLLERGVEYFTSMSKDHGITPGIEHYVGVIDLLGRAGCFRWIENLLLSMPVQPNLALWLCLMGACRTHGNVFLGKQAFDSAVQIQPKHPSAYILMSNIYADVGLWTCAESIGQLRQAAGAWKQMGQSWIGHQEGVHTFVVGNCNDPQHEHVYDLLRKVKTT